MFPLPPKDKNKIGLAIMMKPNPSEPMEKSVDEDLKVCAEDILAAIEKKDVMGLVSALKAFDIIHDREEEEFEDEDSQEQD